MILLSSDECRVLGTLIEKAQTTPAQYPMTLNGLMRGCNQTSGRDPITNFDEDRVFDAVDQLRRKNIVREAMLSDSRVAKYRHVARETLGVNTEELVLLAELMLRGPQPAGELRSRASRMAPLASLESVEAALRALGARPEPMVKEIAAAPGQRARRWVQLLCPTLHPLDHVSRGGDGQDEGEAATPSSAQAGARGLEGRVAELEAECRALRAAISKVCAKLGETDPFG
jgi:uncharacterized protein YceH (UPF0502 family)